jgi:predicted NBD/HSP70 family sugar kinase
LVVDIGGTGVKILATGQSERRRFPSGPTMTPQQMVTRVKDLATDWDYDVVSIGYPGLVRQGQIVSEPHNLAPGWVGFDFQATFGCPVTVMNDAAMQALGSYQSGLMLFLGLGTGLGSALIADGAVWPMELAHLAYKKGTLEDFVGLRGLKRLGKKKWGQHVAFVVARLIAALHPDDIVLGGGNMKKLKTLPPGCRAGDNMNAFRGGFRIWERVDAKYELQAKDGELPANDSVADRRKE